MWRWIGDNLTGIANMGNMLVATTVVVMRLWSRKEHKAAQAAIKVNNEKLDKVVRIINSTPTEHGSS